MRRTLLGLCFGLAAFASGTFAAASFERFLTVSPDLVAAPEVEELQVITPPLTITCEVHGFVMSPEITTMEGAFVCDNRVGWTREHFKADYERFSPNFCFAKSTGQRGRYGEILLMYSCDKCVAAYRARERRAAYGR